MKEYGYIKVDRTITDWRWYKDKYTFCVFLHLILRANYYEKPFGNKIIKRGQIVIGRKKLAEALNISEQNVRTALKHLELTGDITLERFSKYTIVTITDYEKYQLATSNSTSNSTNSSPATNQQLTNNSPQLNKYNKNNKNNKYNNKFNNFDSEEEHEKFLRAFKSKSLFTD